MANIVETISGDRRISLGNEEYIRPMSFGANWTRLRIGIRLAINGRADIKAAAFIQLGVCASTSGGWFVDRSPGFVGARWSGSSDNNPDLTFNAVQANNSYYTIANTDFNPLMKLNNTVTAVARTTTGGAMFVPANNSLTTPHYLMFTLTKSNNLYQVLDMISPQSAAAAQAGKSTTAFLTDMDNELGAGLVNATRSTLAGPITIGTMNVPLTCVSVYWGHSTPTLEITHIAVTRFA